MYTPDDGDIELAEEIERLSQLHSNESNRYNILDNIRQQMNATLRENTEKTLEKFVVLIKDANDQVPDGIDEILKAENADFESLKRAMEDLELNSESAFARLCDVWDEKQKESLAKLSAKRAE